MTGNGQESGRGARRWLWALAIVAVAATVYMLRPAARTAPATDKGAAVAALPRLVDLGADRCVPCKMMAPILVELGTEYAGRLQVDFIDVWKNPDAGTPYRIKVIPTQVFLAADGRELYRHEGFMGKSEILAKWRELGVEL